MFTALACNAYSKLWYHLILHQVEPLRLVPELCIYQILRLEPPERVGQSVHASTLRAKKEKGPG